MKFRTHAGSVVEAELLHFDRSQLVSDGIKSGHYSYLVCSGTLRVMCHQAHCRLRAGQLAWIGSGQSRCIESDGPAEWIVLRVRNRAFSPGNAADQFAWETLIGLGRLSRVHPRPPVCRKTSEALSVIADEMVEWGARKEPISGVMMKSNLMKFLMVLADDPHVQSALETLSSPEPRLDLLHEALLLIEREAAAIEDASALAGRLGLSRSSLYRLFHASALPPPSALIEKARLEMAIRLLENTDQTVLQIALDSGFGSLSAFYRAFHRAFATSPGRWRREA